MIANIAAMQRAVDLAAEPRRVTVADVLTIHALADSTAASRTLGERLSDVEAAWLEAVRPRARSGVEKLISGLVGYPVLSLRTAREVTGASFQATNQAIARLENAGVLRPFRGDCRRNRLWESSEIQPNPTRHDRFG